MLIYIWHFEKRLTVLEYILQQIIFVWREHENMYPCTGSRVITRYERTASFAATVTNAGLRVSRLLHQKRLIVLEYIPQNIIVGSHFLRY